MRSSAADGHQVIGAEGGGGAAAVPGGVVEAEGARQFIAEEAGGDADMGVVETDLVGAEEGAEDAVERLGQRSAGRLAGEDDAGVAAEFRAEGGEFGFGKLVEDQVAEDGGVGRIVAELAQVGAVPRAGGGPGVGAGPEIEAVHGHRKLREAEAEFAGAGAELEREVRAMVEAKTEEEGKKKRR